MFLCEMMSGVLLALGDDKCQSVAPLFRNLASRGASHVKIQVIDVHGVFSRLGCPSFRIWGLELYVSECCRCADLRNRIAR
jgi:hypothetical protein